MKVDVKADTFHWRERLPYCQFVLQRLVSKDQKFTLKAVKKKSKKREEKKNITPPVPHIMQYTDSRKRSLIKRK